MNRSLLQPKKGVFLLRSWAVALKEWEDGNLNTDQAPLGSEELGSQEQFPVKFLSFLCWPDCLFLQLLSFLETCFTSKFHFNVCIVESWDRLSTSRNHGAISRGSVLARFFYSRAQPLNSQLAFIIVTLCCQNRIMCFFPTTY